MRQIRRAIRFDNHVRHRTIRFHPGDIKPAFDEREDFEADRNAFDGKQRRRARGLRSVNDQIVDLRGQRFPIQPERADLNPSARRLPCLLDHPLADFL